MKIVEKQNLIVESLLSYKTRTTYNKLAALIKHVDKSLPLIGMKRTGNIIFTITENSYGCDEPIIDVEIMIPVNRPFKSNEYYVYKPKIVLHNAVMGQCVEVSDALSKAKKELQEYLCKKDYSSLTNYYFIIDGECNVHPVDIYVSINENVV